jgi:hypothetical protein
MKKDDRKKEEFGDIRARDRLKEQSTLKKLNPSAIQVCCNLSSWDWTEVILKMESSVKKILW